ncbi:BNR repeat-containing protein [Planctomycetota bacterium]|nr:BNR repeat-containing protein [Planctomycetota bacterium]
MVIKDESKRKPVIKERVLIDQVWAGHPVRFLLKTVGNKQFVGYYNKDRRMVIAMRKIGDEQFQHAIIPSKLNRPPKYRDAESSTILGWDSHNYIALELDAEGYLHLSGNMHCNRLTYLRSSKPWDISSFEQIDTMVGSNELMCTYPKFVFGPNEELVYHYRDGSSGSGNEIYNIYDTQSQTWKRLLDQPLADGQGKMNAYIFGPIKGPDGYFHASWVWRDTSDCSTNHDLSYARSKDLVNWETAAGKPINLPITLKTKGVIVDPIPVKGGIINGSGQVGFDLNNNAVLTYHKFDKSGKTQAYSARFEGNQWKIKQLTDWNYRWYFSGGGSISSEVYIGRMEKNDSQLLQLTYSHRKNGSGCWLLNNDLEIVGKLIRGQKYPQELMSVQSDFQKMGVRWASDQGDSGELNVKYVLRWETLGRNRDKPRDPPYPAPSNLVLYKIAYE